MTSHEKVIMTGVTAHVPCLGTQDLNTENWQFLTERERNPIIVKKLTPIEVFPNINRVF